MTNLIEHLKRHDKELLKCDLCPVTKVSQSRMEGHVKMRHLVITCPVCNMKLEGGINFKTHRDNGHRPSKIRNMPKLL